MYYVCIWYKYQGDAGKYRNPRDTLSILVFTLVEYSYDIMYHSGGQLYQVQVQLYCACTDA
jgi:hypothetical protein